MFQFTDDCLIGIEQIDEEHKKLFTLLNKAGTLLANDFSNDRYQELKEIIEELDRYADQHFTHEEAYMVQIRDPEIIRQRAQHSYFREKIRDFEFTNINDIADQQIVLTE